MKEFWNTIQFIFTAVGGWLGYYLGGCDGLLYSTAWRMRRSVRMRMQGIPCSMNPVRISIPEKRQPSSRIW